MILIIFDTQNVKRLITINSKVCFCDEREFVLIQSVAVIKTKYFGNEVNKTFGFVYQR